jgi:hypothetical protein
LRDIHRDERLAVYFPAAERLCSADSAERLLDFAAAGAVLSQTVLASQYADVCPHLDCLYGFERLVSRLGGQLSRCSDDDGP